MRIPLQRKQKTWIPPLFEIFSKHTIIIHLAVWNFLFNQIKYLNTILLWLIHSCFGFDYSHSLRNYNFQLHPILELSYDQTYSSTVSFSTSWFSVNLTLKETLYLKWVIIRLILQPCTSQSYDSVEIRHWKRYYTWTQLWWDLFINLLLFDHPIHQKSDTERDTILELSNDKTYSSAFYFSILWFRRNLTLKEILYLNLMIVKLIHQRFTFQSSDSVKIWHWKRYYTWI